MNVLTKKLIIPFVLSCILAPLSIFAKTIHVGTNLPIQNLLQASHLALPGDTIMFNEGVYSGGLYIENLRGAKAKPIYIIATQGTTVIHRGGNNAWQLTDASYLIIENMIFENQTGNGLNIDDGGSYESPSHHIEFRNCTFRNINATGNNDLLKLSGLDSFSIISCTFLNGAEGGSGIDMVGCHQGIITQNTFENMGSNAIQAKGGTQYITISRNAFTDCGQRSLNLGGSTGLQFFRPIDATFEAADIVVIANIFTGSVAPIAYVGCTRVAVTNNTIITPEKWIFRILQETVDPNRFVACGNNTFINNIIYKNNTVTTDVNIGGNTDPQSFLISNNLWYNYENPNWQGPTTLPVTEPNKIVMQNPLFMDITSNNFQLLPNSPAIGRGLPLNGDHFDFGGYTFSAIPSIGAWEGKIISFQVELQTFNNYYVYPNPAADFVFLHTPNNISLDLEVIVYNTLSQATFKSKYQKNLPIYINKGMNIITLVSKNEELYCTKIIGH